MKIINVELGDRAYPIVIGNRAMHSKEHLDRAIKGQSVLIVTNDMVGPLYAAQLAETLSSLGKTVQVHMLPTGEQYKNLETLNSIFDALL